MSSAVESVSKVSYSPTPSTHVIKVVVKDKDGDHDGSKASEAEKAKTNTAKPTSGPVGTQVDAYA